MKASRLWPWIVVGVVVLVLGVFTMGTEAGSTQWIIGLVVVIVGVALLTWTGIAARRRRRPI